MLFLQQYSLIFQGILKYFLKNCLFHLHFKYSILQNHLIPSFSFYSSAQSAIPMEFILILILYQTL